MKKLDLGKRYLIFGGDDFQGIGGFNDFIGALNDLNSLKVFFKKKHNCYEEFTFPPQSHLTIRKHFLWNDGFYRLDWIHILDTETSTYYNEIDEVNELLGLIDILSHVNEGDSL